MASAERAASSVSDNMPPQPSILGNTAAEANQPSFLAASSSASAAGVPAAQPLYTFSTSAEDSADPASPDASTRSNNNAFPYSGTLLRPLPPMSTRMDPPTFATNGPPSHALGDLMYRRDPQVFQHGSSMPQPPPFSSQMPGEPPYNSRQAASSSSQFAIPASSGTPRKRKSSSRSAAEASPTNGEDSDDSISDNPKRRSSYTPKGNGRRRIDIAYIKDKHKRHISFSKRKAGIMKKAHELSVLTGTEVLLLIASDSGSIYTFATNKLKPLISGEEAKMHIQDCLSAPDPGSASPSPPSSPMAPDDAIPEIDLPAGASAYHPPPPMPIPKGRRIAAQTNQQRSMPYQHLQRP